MKKIVSILTAVCCTLITGCNASKPENNSAGTEPETTLVRLALGSNGHIFNAIAQEQGYLAAEGITVAYVPVKNDIEVFKGIRNGLIDVASNSGTNLPLQYISEGMDLTIFGGYMLTG